MAFTPVPFDIISDVLSRVPAKSLVRFRCVCKLWYSSQADPYFVNLYSSRSKLRLASSNSQLMVSCMSKRLTNQSFVLSELRGNDDVSEKSMIFTFESSLFSPIINCLICVIDLSSVTVCNLSTRETLRLPKTVLGFKNEERKSCYPCYLFGSDETERVYKVLNICTICTTDRNQRQRSRKVCEILTVGATGNSWRRLAGKPFRLFPSRSKPASGHYNQHIQSVCIKGIIYWIQHEDMRGGRMIGGFHVGDERFIDLIPLPDTAVEDPTIMEFNGRLALQHYSPVLFAETRVWVLQNDESKSWNMETITPRDIKTRAFTLGAFDYHGNMILGTSLEGFLTQFVPSSLLREPGDDSGDEKIWVRFSSVDGVENIHPLKKVW